MISPDALAEQPETAAPLFVAGELAAVLDVYMQQYTSARVAHVSKDGRNIHAGGRWYDGDTPHEQHERDAFRLCKLTPEIALLAVRGDALAAIRGTRWELLDTPTLQRVADALADAMLYQQ